MFEFEKPLDCRKITIKSGAYQTSHYIITHAIVEISTDGERFMRSGWFDAEGDSEVICTVPIKALRIVFTEPQYEERLVLQDLNREMNVFFGNTTRNIIMHYVFGWCGL